MTLTISKRTHSAFAAAFAAAQETKPIDMVLHCPECWMQHIDAPEGPSQREGDSPEVATGMAILDGAWTNPPHRSHLCRGCGLIWRPADVATNGVKAIKTKGENDDQIEPRHSNTLLNAQVNDFFEGLGASEDIEAIMSVFRSIGLAEDTINHILAMICRSKPPGKYPGAQSAEKIKN